MHRASTLCPGTSQNLLADSGEYQGDAVLTALAQDLVTASHALSSEPPGGASAALSASRSAARPLARAGQQHGLHVVAGHLAGQL